jgi:hypothetical protein
MMRRAMEGQRMFGMAAHTKDGIRFEKFMNE